MYRRLSLIALSGLLVANSPPKPTGDEDFVVPKPRWVTKVPLASLLSIIANPERFHGKTVDIVGFVAIEFESSAIYLSEIDRKQGITKNGRWISRAKGIDPSEKCNFRYCLIRGTFNARSGGHMGHYSGSIEALEKVLPWPPKEVGRNARPPQQ